MEHTVITDLYEASWLLINGCVLDEVECIKLSGKLACQFTFLGKRLTGGSSAFAISIYVTLVR